MEEKSECKGMAGGNFYAVGIVLYLVGGDGYKNVCVKTQMLGRARAGTLLGFGARGQLSTPQRN